MSSLGSRASTQCTTTDQVISPVLVESLETDRSYVDSVVEMISDVVPVGSAIGVNSIRKSSRPHELVNWVKMFNTEVLNGQDSLFIGMVYGDGLQIFAVGLNGEARTILSRRNSSPVKDFCLLPSPPKENTCKNDAFGMDRPLVAICELNTISILSMNTGTLRFSLSYNAHKVLASKCALIAACQTRIAVFDSNDLSPLFELPTAGLVPVALGHRWLAYAEKSLSTQNATPGGLQTDPTASVTVTVMNAAKTIKSGISRFGGTVTGISPPRRSNALTGLGVVSVVDILAKDVSRMLLHFLAHKDPIAGMSFDPAGNLLITADTIGRHFHVFRLLPHPVGSSQAKVDHLYILHRGDTSASVWDLNFSLDSRWVSVSTARGTIHVFPIAPYGGLATVRTHVGTRVVNKLSAYQRSAGVNRDHDKPQTVKAAAQIRHNLSAEEAEFGSRKGDGYLLSMTFSSGRACWLGNNKNVSQATNRDSLFAVSTTGLLLEYILDVRPKLVEGNTVKPSDHEHGIDVTSSTVAQWRLLTPNVILDSGGRQQTQSKSRTNAPMRKNSDTSTPQATGCWMSQVEIVTYASPHRRIWMGPQFTFRPNGKKSGEIFNMQVSNGEGLVEVSNNELVVEHLAEAMNEQTPSSRPSFIHSSADSLYHSPREGPYEESETLIDQMTDSLQSPKIMVASKTSITPKNVSNRKDGNEKKKRKDYR